MNRLRKTIMTLSSIDVPSGKENRIIPFIMKRIISNGWKVSMDNNFNIIAIPKGYNFKNKIPMLVAHMDNISYSLGSSRRKVYYDDSNRVIYTNNKNVTGGDDKCGIAIILRMIEDYRKNKKDFMAIFTREEESGVGASRLSGFAIDKASYAIVIDRRGASDVVISISSTELCDDKFSDFIVKCFPSKLSKKREAKKIRSVFSDAYPLKNKGVDNVVNISCGYYNPHSTREYIDMHDLYASYIWVKNILNEKNEFNLV